MTNKSNILVIVIDGLAQQELPLSGDTAGLVPTIRGLAEGGTTLTNCFAHGPTTEFAVPSLVTSTHPLDHGGYQTNLDGRPPSFLGVAKHNGYRTGLISESFFLDELYRFSRDADHHDSLYDIQVVWRYLKLARLNHLTEELGGKTEYVEKCAETVERFYEFLIALCRRLETDRRSRRGGERYLSYDFPAIEKGLLVHLSDLQADPAAYVETMVPEIKAKDILEFLRMSPMTRRWKRTLASFDGARLPGTGIVFRGYEKNAPTESAMAKLFGWLAAVKDQPFAGLFHVMDVHDGLFSGNPYFMTAGRDTQARLRNVTRKGFTPTRHELALAYIDACLEQLVTWLRREGLTETTRLLITSDHGARTAAGQTCLASTTPSGSLKDIYLSVPFILNGPGIDRRESDALQQSLNVAPTVCDLLGANAPTGYKGRSILGSDDAVDCVISEHTHRGICDLKEKPIYMSIRVQDFKYVWKEGFSVHDKGPRVHEQIFDLQRDPNETTNLFVGAETPATLPRFRDLRRQRVAEIRGDQH